MEKIPRLSTQQRSDLVAYLDGELNETASREIERILTHSPVARNEVEVLMRTWEMLDALPMRSASEDFTERTMSTIRIDDYREPLSEKLWFQRTRRGVIIAGWVAGLVVAAVIGFSAGTLQAQDPVQAARSYVESHRAEIVTELREFVAIPNVASDEVNIRRNAEALVAMMKRRGIATLVLEAGGPPVVYGEIGATRTH